jgi:hypothetical protein
MRDLTIGIAFDAVGLNCRFAHGRAGERGQGAGGVFHPPRRVVADDERALQDPPQGDAQAPPRLRCVETVRPLPSFRTPPRASAFTGHGAPSRTPSEGRYYRLHQAFRKAYPRRAGSSSVRIRGGAMNGRPSIPRASPPNCCWTSSTCRSASTVASCRSPAGVTAALMLSQAIWTSQELDPERRLVLQVTGGVDRGDRAFALGAGNGTASLAHWRLSRRAACRHAGEALVSGTTRSRRARIAGARQPGSPMTVHRPRHERPRTENRNQRR